MKKFVGRERELAELNMVLEDGGAQFIIVYGQRRTGKTTLVLRWAEMTGRPVIYWVATRDTPAQVRLGFTQALWAWAYPGSQAVPRFDTWAEIFETAAQLAENGFGKVILVTRNLDKGEAARAQLVERTGKDVFDLLSADLSEPKSAAVAADELVKRQETIDLLILNAGMSAGAPPVFNSDGVEVTFASTLIGHHVLTMR